MSRITRSNSWSSMACIKSTPFEKSTDFALTPAKAFSKRRRITTSSSTIATFRTLPESCSEITPSALSFIKRISIEDSCVLWSSTERILSETISLMLSPWLASTMELIMSFMLSETSMSL